MAMPWSWEAEQEGWSVRVACGGDVLGVVAAVALADADAADSMPQSAAAVTVTPLSVTQEEATLMALERDRSIEAQKMHPP